MRKGLYIGLLAFGLTGCATIGTPPLDDVYYWPDKNASTTVAAQSAQPAPAVQVNPNPGPELEFVSVKDTTVTVRIKR